MTTRIAAVEEPINGQNRSADAHVAATQGIDAASKRCLSIVHQLDAIIRNKFRTDPAMLAAWTSASHIERPPKRKQTAAAPQQPTEPPK